MKYIIKHYKLILRNFFCGNEVKANVKRDIFSERIMKCITVIPQCRIID